MQIKASTVQHFIYRISGLVEGKGSNDGKYGIAEVDQDGKMEDIDDNESFEWESEDFEFLENKFNIDLDKNNLIENLQAT